MTDIGPWPQLVEKKGTYIMVPLNAYQMGNLIDAIAQVPDTGDWWHEFQFIVAKAMDVAGLDKIQSNNGRTFTHDQLVATNIRK